MNARSLITSVDARPPGTNSRSQRAMSAISPSRISLPRNCSRVGLHIDLFEACSAFTHVAARTLAPSPIRDLLHRRLQPFRHLHDCSGCFRLERSPGGACTHWKAPPSHGARKKQPFTAVAPQNTDYDQEPTEQALRQGEGDAYWSSPWACREVCRKAGCEKSARPV